MNFVLLGHLMTELGRNSLQAAVLVLAVLVAQWISGKRLAPRWRCGLWLLVVVRLLIPVSVSSTVSLFNIWPYAMQWVSDGTLHNQIPTEIPRVTPIQIITAREVMMPQMIPHHPFPPQAVEPTRSAPLSPLPQAVAPGPIASVAVMPAPDAVKLPSRIISPVERQPREPMKPTQPIQPAPAPKTVTVSAPRMIPTAAMPPSSTLPSVVPAALPSIPSSSSHVGHRGPILFNLPSWPDDLLCLFWIWLAGATTLLGHIVISSLRLARRCARMRPLNDPTIIALLEDCCNRMDMSRRPILTAPVSALTIVETVEATSPALHGLWHSRLLLPKGFTAKFSAEELRFVLLHELAHLKRRDLWMNWLMALLQAVHWFNPLIWLAFARWRDDRELACDVMVLEAMGAEYNQEYGETILRLLENFTHPMRTPGLVGILEEKRQMRQRIEMIASYAPSPRWSVLAVFLIAVLAVVGLADVRSAAPASSPSATPADTPKPVSQLTIELRDGSHLVAKGRDEILPFHSATLGDLKLAVTGIRSIEFEGESNTARVTGINGDVLDVQFVPTNLHVETDFGKSELPVKLIRSLKISTTFPTGLPGPTYPAETGSQLTIDLQDGSRVLGKSLDETLGFHSASLGDFKLSVTGIRSIVIDTAGMARLTATNGDVLDVQLTTPALHVETAFGKSELAVKIIRSIKVFSTGSKTQLPLGLVGLWSGNDNGDDSVGTNNAIVPPGITYAPAKVGDGFQFNGNVGAVSVPASPSLDVGKSGGFTLSCWIAPDSATTPLPLMEWSGDPQARNWAIYWGVHFWISALDEGVGGPGCLYANIVDTEGNYHFFASPSGIVQPKILQYTAVTYDKERGIGNIYYNGTLVATKYLGIFTPKTDTSLLFGARLGREETHFQGILNDLAVYDKALCADEIEGIYNKQNTVLAKSTNKTEVPILSDGQLTLELRDGSRVIGKSLDDPLQFHSASLGDFKLPVAGIQALEFSTDSNNITAHLSATNGDVLDVQLVAPSLHLQTGFGKSELPVKMIRSIKTSSTGGGGQIGGMPSGLVALWTGNGNGDDSVGTNNAIVPAGVTYAPAKVGEGFQFEGNSGGVSVPASPELNVGAGPGFTVTCWINPNSVSMRQPIVEWGNDRSPGNGVTYWGVHLWVAESFQGVGGPGALYGGIADMEGQTHFFASPLGTIQPGVLQQVALTYDKATGVGNLYVNGTLVAAHNVGSFTAQTDGQLLIGERTDGGDVRYQGIINDVAIFNRALTAEEIQAMYHDQNEGMPSATPAPSLKPTASDAESAPLVYDAKTDFSPTKNPAGAWTYGWSSDLGGDLHVYTDAFLTASSECWSDPSSLSLGTPHVSRNNHDQTIDSIPAHAMNMHPGPQNQFSHCRCTVASAGDYTIQASFTALSSGGPHVYILHNGTCLGDSLLTQGVPWNFSANTVALEAGDTVDAVVGVGQNNSFYNDATQFSLTISNSSQPSSPSTNPSSPLVKTRDSSSQLILELRDGSRVVGKSLDDPLQFHSASLGDFKLPVTGIQSLEFGVDSNSMTARLTATSGDVLDVQFTAPTLHVESSFGKSDVPVKMIQSIKVSALGNTFEIQADGALPGAIQNPSFETPDVTGRNAYFSYNTDPTNAGWTFVNSAGVAKNGSGMAYYKSGTTNGTQFAWLQGLHGVGSSMSQTITNLPSGTYAFKFIASQRDQIGRDNSENQTVTVLVDGTSVGSFTPADINWSDYQTTPVFLSAGDHTLTFTNLPVPGDAMILVDNVSIEKMNASGEKPADPIAVTSPKETSSQLTLEFRDGSRVVGKSLDDPLKFHSASLGDFKLPVAGIRSIEFHDKGDDGTARLTATNGDVLDVQLVAPLLHVETGFGKTELQVKMIRSIKIPSVGAAGQAGRMHSGLVALWQGNDNGEDSVGTNNAIVPEGIKYAPAIVGDGFSLDGPSLRILVPDAPGLNFGAGQSFSIAGWIQPIFSSRSGEVISFVDKRDVPTLYQCKGYEFNLFEGRLHCRLSDSSNGNGGDWGPAGPDLRDGKFHFITLTVERNSVSGGKMYVDGQLVITFDPTGVSGDLSTDQPLRIGNHPLDPQGQAFFYGVINNVALYKRALTTEEIQAMYQERDGEMSL